MRSPKENDNTHRTYLAYLPLVAACRPDWFREKAEITEFYLPKDCPAPKMFAKRAVIIAQCLGVGARLTKGIERLSEKLADIHYELPARVTAMTKIKFLFCRTYKNRYIKAPLPILTENTGQNRDGSGKTDPGRITKSAAVLIFCIEKGLLQNRHARSRFVSILQQPSLSISCPYFIFSFAPEAAATLRQRELPGI